MRAIRFEEDGAHLIELPRPEPGSEEIVVQVLAAGVCRTDLHLLHDVKAGRRKALVPGHEIAGRVVDVGRDVYRVRVGDPVAVHFEQPCGRCRHCRRKRTNLCEEGHSLGFDLPGGYAEFVRGGQGSVLALPPEMDLAFAATLGCSGATAVHAVVAVGQVQEGDLVAVVGAGGVGLSAVQVARTHQARVLAVDLREEARNAAKEVGAERTASPEEFMDALRSMAGEAGADIVVDLVGTAESLEQSRKTLGVGGRLVVVAGGDDTIPVSASGILFGGRAYLGSYSSTMADFATALRLAEAGKLRSVVSRRARLSEAPDILRDLEAGRIVGRAVLEPLRT